MNVLYTSTINANEMLISSKKEIANIILSDIKKRFEIALDILLKCNITIKIIFLFPKHYFYTHI